MKKETLYYYVLGWCVQWNTEGKQFTPESDAFYDFVSRTYSKVRSHVVHNAKLDASFSDFEIIVAENLMAA